MPRVYDAFLRHAAAYPNRVAFSDDREQVSYLELPRRVAALARRLDRGPQTIGILARNGVPWVIAQLAGMATGKIVVPLPTFFSPAQLGHIVNDAGVDLILITDEMAARSTTIGVPKLVITNEDAEALPSVVEGFGQIIYTSGSTGRPKGVLHAQGQMEWSAAALASATQASERDIFLSVLPLPLLLETICAILVPLLAGARTHFDVATAIAVAEGRLTGLSSAFKASGATTTVLVPQLLRGWVAELAASRERAPASLRFVAVGGAPLPAATADQARTLGLPVFEGYGLSECCSVVAVNTEAARKPGSVGRPLPGLLVTIDHGEIIVDGPSVMDRYVNGPPRDGPWRTGDLGELDDDGFLTIRGRKDNLLVTAFGRNVSPEWIETMLLDDARLSACLVWGYGEPALRALLIPSPTGADWFTSASPDAILNLFARSCRSAPKYAIPQEYRLLSAPEARKLDLFAPDGGLRRKKTIEYLSESDLRPSGLAP